MKRILYVVTVLLFSLACSLPAIGVTPTPLPPTPTETPAFTSTPEATFTPTITLTSTITFTPSITPSPTFSFPTVKVNKQAHCRYGPSVAFLHAADLYAGDTGTVRGRFEYSSWLYIKFDKLDYFCWVAPSVVDVSGDVNTIYYEELDLLSIGYNQYGPPANVYAVRNGDEVTINWDQVEMSGDKDRGYLIIAFVCQGGAYLWWTYSYPDQYTTSYTVKDEPGCPVPSEGVIYTVEKHGFSQPATIPWPAP
jgi:hypothetical protein